MRQAAQAACLSVGGLYHYFPTKRDVFLAAIDQYLELIQRQRRLAPPGPAQGLRAQLGQAFAALLSRQIRAPRPRGCTGKKESLFLSSFREWRKRGSHAPRGTAGRLRSATVRLIPLFPRIWEKQAGLPARR